MQVRNSLIIVALIVAAAATRLMPHPPNFAPVMSIALFGSAVFANRWGGIAIAIAAMAQSDMFIGSHSTLPFVYVGMLVTGMLGFFLRSNRTAFRILNFTLAGSIIFFVVSNLGVFLTQDLYPKTWAGLVACYVAAVPFFQNSVAADVLFSGILFTLHHFFIALREKRLIEAH